MTDETSNEVVLAETFTREQMIEQLHGLGLAPSTIARTAGVAPSVVKTVLQRRKITTTLPADPEIAEAWKTVELEVIDHVQRTLRFGAQQDRMALMKIVTGRAMARRAGETSEQIEEMRMAWEEIREEQRAAPLAASPNADWDADEDEDEWHST